MTPDERFVWDEMTHDQLFDILYQQPDISDSQLKTMLLYRFLSKENPVVFSCRDEFALQVTVVELFRQIIYNLKY